MFNNIQKNGRNFIGKLLSGNVNIVEVNIITEKYCIFEIGSNQDRLFEK